MASEIRTLQLLKDKDFASTVFEVKKDWTLHFRLDSRLNHGKVKFFCNYPVVNKKFHPYTFLHYPWKNETPSILFPDCYAEVRIQHAGVYKFFLQEDEMEKFCCGRFIVQPDLTLASGKRMDIQSVTMQTVLTKCLGQFKDWKNRLQVAHECNYNTIHFTPIQELGESDSSYSIRDHHRFDRRYGEDLNEASLDAFIKTLHSQWNMFSIVDVVWNHVSNDCEWIKDHPEASYNLVNTPHLRPAFLVDRSLWYFNKEIMQGEWKDEGLPDFISNESHLNSLATILRRKLENLHLEEYYMVDIDNTLMEFDKLNIDAKKKESKPIEIFQDDLYQKFGSTINIEDAVNQFNNRSELQEHLKVLNKNKQDFIDFVIQKVIDSTLGHVRYHFLEPHGPKYGAVTEQNSIAVRYFCYPFEDSNIENDVILMNSPQANLLMAHNGWVAGGDVLKGFIGKDSLVFLCRELHAWGDSIKLRYGDSPYDVPFIWDYMKKYTENMARIFHGIRLDNCHSTPLHVAEYLLYAARKIRPDLYVIAELFTSSEHTDNIFVNRLGINSMIRENLGAFSPYDLGRHIYRFGGPPTGSFMLPTNRRELQPTVAPALFMDVTHDNEAMFTKRSVFDFLPSCALVAAGSFATGSTRGYDELVPHHINVVTDNRYYQSWSDANEAGHVFFGEGMLSARKTLNDIHTEMRDDGYNEIFVDQMTNDIVAVTRHCPDNHKSIITVGHCAFSWPEKNKYPKIGRNSFDDHPPLIVEGELEEILFEGQLLEKEETTNFAKHPQYINGNTNYVLYSQKNIRPARSNLCTLHMTEKGLEIRFKSFFPGSVLIVKVSGKETSEKAINGLRSTLNMFPSFKNDYQLNVDKNIKCSIAEIKPIIDELSLVDLNKVLYRSDPEERDDGLGGGVYDIPGFGKMVYCGLQGLISMLSDVAKNNDLGHPSCNNLRQGDWMLGFTANRLKNFPGTKRLAAWLESVFDLISVLPRFLIPSYFEAIIRNVYEMCIARSHSLMSKFVIQGSQFTRHLAMASVQLCGEVNSATLPAVEESSSDLNVTLAAGLPHFATGFMRCWGRDTFISLRGLMLITGRFDVARTLLLSYGGCVRHGLVPNLLASGINARYNARDATWFWLQAVQEYTIMADEGVNFLNSNVLRMYPTDDSEPLVENPKSQPLHETIHEILTCHYNGISFTERNAGERLDRDMSDRGFHVQAGVNENGFVEGGSEHNCGTWMDKMGGSTIAKNKGVPATPRSGSAVEIVGLSKSALRWLIQLKKEGKYPHDTIFIQSSGEKITYKEWESKIQENFDKYFFISEDSTEPHLHKRNIYKDTLGAHHNFMDKQLRPNFPIAMCAAPEMFVPENAWKALDMIEKHLLGPLGLKTLDPDDWAYDGYYENDLDNTNSKKAKGFNYHNGPEWVWVLGPYLRARLIFAKLLNKADLLDKTISRTREILSKHKNEIQKSPWRGLTELTNKDGECCPHSCPTQAWSSACLMEVVYDLQQLSK